MSNINTIAHKRSNDHLAMLRDFATMAKGIKGKEGIYGGAGNIGILNGRVVKFNTHWTERLFQIS